MSFTNWTTSDHDRRAVQLIRERHEVILVTMDSVLMASMRPVCMDHNIHFVRAVTVEINRMIRKIRCTVERTYDFLYVKGK